MKVAEESDIVSSLAATNMSMGDHTPGRDLRFAVGQEQGLLTGGSLSIYTYGMTEPSDLKPPETLLKSPEKKE